MTVKTLIFKVSFGYLSPEAIFLNTARKHILNIHLYLNLYKTILKGLMKNNSLSFNKKNEFNFFNQFRHDNWISLQHGGHNLGRRNTTQGEYNPNGI